MNRNTWLIIVVEVSVIFGLVWIFNRDPADASMNQINVAPAIQESLDYRICLTKYPLAHDFCAARTDKGL